MIFGWLAAAALAVALFDPDSALPTRANAGAPSCRVVHHATLGTFPLNDGVLQHLRLAMSDRGGLAFWRDESDQWMVQPLDADGNARGKPKAFTAAGGVINDLVALGKMIALLFIETRCTRAISCVKVFLFDLAGRASEPAELATTLFPAGSWAHGGQWTVLLEGPTFIGAARVPDQLIEIRVAGGKPVMTSTAVELEPNARSLFQAESEGTWILSARTEMRRGYTSTRLRALDESRRVRDVLDYSPDYTPLATAKGHQLISWTRAHEQYVVHEIQPNGEAKELRRVPGKTGQLPKPFSSRITADLGSGREVLMYRHDALGDVGRPVRVTNHIAPMLGDVVFARGTFFVFYGERAKEKMMMKTERLDCR